MKTCGPVDEREQSQHWQFAITCSIQLVYMVFCNKYSSINRTSLKCFNSSFSDALPCIESATMDLARVFELPGLPTRKSGILSSMEMVIMNTFSLRAAFLAMLRPNNMFSNSTSWHLREWKSKIKVREEIQRRDRVEKQMVENGAWIGVIIIPSYFIFKLLYSSSEG